MPGRTTGLPSRQTLCAEREQVRSEIAQDREVIIRMRARIAEVEQCFAKSFDKLAESQKLIKRDRVRTSIPPDCRSTSAPST